MTTGDICAHLGEIYDTSISPDTISRITDAVLEDLQIWQVRPLDRVYPVILIDAIVVKIRDGQVANRPIYLACGINLDGERDVLGLWVGPTGAEGAKYSAGPAHPDLSLVAAPAVFDDGDLSERAMHVRADRSHPPAPLDERLRNVPGEAATATDSRSQRSRASRRGGGRTGRTRPGGSTAGSRS